MPYENSDKDQGLTPANKNTHFASDDPINQPTNQLTNYPTNQLINLSTNQLINYTLHLADNALILGHRNSEWTGHGPVLEQDIALSNIALDLIGQARHFYQYAARLINESDNEFNQSTDQAATEDTLAYLRDVRDFKNCLMLELPNGDWGKTLLRQFFFSTYQFYLFQQLQSCTDADLAAIAEKSLKETTYHLRWSAEWVIRLGDGTTESHTRVQQSLDSLWSYTGEIYTPEEFEVALFEKAITRDYDKLKENWLTKVNEVLKEATIQAPASLNNQKAFMHTGGKSGIHTEHLGYLLSEMQFLQRAYPNSEW